MKEEKIHLTTENQKEWVLLDEAAKCSIYSKRQIGKLAEKGIQRIKSKKAEDGKHLLYNKLDIIKYAAAHPKDTILNTVWDEIDYIPGEKFEMIPGYDCKYFLSDKNRIINCSNGQVLSPQPHKDMHGKETGYSYVTLRQNGKNKDEKMHRLIGKLRCPNILRKDIYHHIDGDKSNNKASNILPVWFEQHNELHEIMPRGTKLKDLTQQDKKKYLEMVRLIKAENKQKLHKIPHLDYNPDENYDYFMLVTTEGYKYYKVHNDVPLNCIVMESAESKEIEV